MRDHLGAPGTGLSRREFIAATGSTGALSLAGCVAPTGRTETPSQSLSGEHSSPEIEKWLAEVPRPGVLEPVGEKDGNPYYEVEMREIEQKIHPNLPPTTVWGYDGQYPGPTIEAQQGEPVYVRWMNKLPNEHLLPVDETIHSSKIPYDSTGVRVVTHLHGGNVEHTSDGKPTAWFTRDFEQTGPKFKKKDYYYVNDQPPATLWYHDHSLGITRLNVYAGLAGLYLLRNDREESLGLPSGEYEIPLVLQDRSFNDDGSLFYPTARSGTDSDSPNPNPSIVSQFFGDTSVVNGKAWPRLSVDPRKYRFRILNGSNCRFYNLKLFEYNESDGTTGAGGPPFTLVGNDGGLLASPVTIEDRLEIGTGKRADVVVDFSDYAGQTLLVHNDAAAPYRGPDINTGEQQPLPDVMLVDVAADDVDDPSQVPSTLAEVPEIPVDSVDEERYLPMTMSSDEYGRPLHLLGSEAESSPHKLYDPVTEEPTLNDTEIWSFANLTGMSHPMHMHLVHFQVLGRQPYSEYDPEAETIDIESLEPPAPEEMGWNDVVTANPGEVTHVIVHFGGFEGLFNDQTGWYMWHCHMLEHEDHDMMRPFRVLPYSGGDNDDGS
ncbi:MULTISPECIES: multicopper oxidase family protein [Halobacteriales]|uniref:multicopper oxidase family protein n=2 Tax=Halobacteria TaxID=183963 RepID=UPI000E27543F